MSVAKHDSSHSQIMILFSFWLRMRACEQVFCYLVKNIKQENYFISYFNSFIQISNLIKDLSSYLEKIVCWIFY